MTESKTPIMDAFYDEIAGDSDAQLAMKTFDKAKQLEGELAVAKTQIVVLRELAKAAYDSRTLGRTDAEEALHRAIGEE